MFAKCFKLLSLSLLLGSVCATPAMALSDGLYSQLQKSSSAYAEAEKNLGGVWKKLEKSLSPQKLSQLKKEQKAWVDQQRDAKVMDMVKTVIANPDAASAYLEKGKLDLGQMYANATMDQAKSLNILAAQAKDNAPVTLAGNFAKQSLKNGNFITFTPYLWNKSFILCSEADAAKLPKASRTAMNNAIKNNKLAKVTGKLHGTQAYELNGLKIEELGEGMAWRELDTWDNFE